MMQLISKSLQVSATAIKQLAHHALAESPQNSIHRETNDTSASRVGDQEVNFSLLMGGERMLDKTLNQALRPEAEKAAAWLPARLWMTMAAVPMGPELPEAEH
jgi:hypothetical protein